MADPFDFQVRYVEDGEPGDAGTTNRPIRDVADALARVAAEVRAARDGYALRQFAAPVDPAAVVGSPVSWDPAAGRFALARAELAAGGAGFGPLARVWGIVEEKVAPDTATLVTLGVAAVDVSPALGGGPVPAGVLYVDPARPGRLTAARPPLAVPALDSDGRGMVAVGMGGTDLLDRHAHRRLDLVCRPAGRHVPPAPGSPHVVTDPDPALPGWLPAGHPSFGGLAPAGAVWGYNLAADPAARAAWPLTPPDGAYVDWDRGTAWDRGFVGAGPEHVRLTRDGIWWLTAAYGEVPWPVPLDTTDPASRSESVGAAGRPMRVRVWGASVRLATAGSVVTALTSRDTRLKVDGCGGQAETGPLCLSLDLSPAVTPGDAGYQVLKGVNEDGTAFTRGPVVSGVYAAGGGFTLVGDESEPLDPANPAGGRVYRGRVGLQLGTVPEADVPAEVFRVAAGVEQGYADGLPYFRFPAGRAGQLLVKAVLPDSLGVPNPAVTLRLWVYAPTGGTVPALSLLARRVPVPAAGGSALPTAGADAPVGLAAAGAVAAGGYKRVDADPLPAAAGEVVLFTLSRSAADGYAGEIGLVRVALAVRTAA